MAYIGRDTDKISNVEVLDNITFDGSSSYTLQKGGSNFTPSSANTLLLSIDGVVQAGNFTVSGSTINFGTAVAGTSTCDFVLHYGVGLITSVSDGTVTEAKIGTGAVTSAKLNYPLTTFSSTGIDDNATSTAITIDSSENVGIGTASPQNKLDISATTWDDGILIKNTGSFNTAIIADANRTGADTGILNLASKWNGTEVAGILFQTGSDTTNKDDGEIAFRTASAGTPAERMRIDSSGGVNVGSEGTAGTATGLNVHNHGWSTMDTFKTGTSTNAQYVQFINSNGVVGSINMSGSSTSYNTSSDYRLKENIVEITDATSRLKQLKPARFNFIADADTTVDGFIAHEVSSVVPEAISGEKDATETKEKVVVSSDGNVIAENIEQTDWEAGKIADENGNTQYPTDSTWEATKVVPVYQGIDQSKLVPLLVKTIQELEARITALENA